MHFKLLAGTRNSDSRCGSVVSSAFQVPFRHSKFVLPLRIYNEFLISSPLLALEIRVPAGVYSEFYISSPLQTREIHMPAEANEFCT